MIYFKDGLEEPVENPVIPRLIDALLIFLVRERWSISMFVSAIRMFQFSGCQSRLLVIHLGESRRRRQVD